ncbi:hypothetical protein WME75_04555 [Sorangium sp. So ce1014]
MVHIDPYGANLSSGGYGNSMGQIRANSFDKGSGRFAQVSAAQLP